MDEVAAAQMRQRLTRWIEESRELLGALPELLDSDQKASARSDQVEREAEGMRKEVGDLRKENAELRKDIGEAQKALDDLRRENEQLRSEKEEAAAAFAKLLETVQSTNQIAQKLGVTRSPFARPHAGGAATATAPGAPTVPPTPSAPHP